MEEKLPPAPSRTISAFQQLPTLGIGNPGTNAPGIWVLGLRLLEPPGGGGVVQKGRMGRGAQDSELPASSLPPCTLRIGKTRKRD